MNFKQIEQIFKKLYAELKEETGQATPDSNVYFDSSFKKLYDALKPRNDLVEKYKDKRFEEIGTGTPIAFCYDVVVYDLTIINSNATTREVEKYFSDIMFLAEDVESAYRSVAKKLVQAGHEDLAKEVLALSGNESYNDYLLKADEEFLKVCIPLIKKEAGTHAKEVVVKNGKTMVWLQYTGEDRSDISMELNISLLPELRGPYKATVFVQGSQTGRSFEKEHTYSVRELVPKTILDIFKEYFN